MTSLKVVFTFVLLVFGTACSSTPPLITPQSLPESQVEITYLLGHNQYRYLAIAKTDEAELSSFRDETLIEKRMIPLSRYQAFIKRVEEAFKASEEIKEDEECRMPYQIQVKAGDQERSTLGCRSSDTDGKIGQLIQEGEFLFYSEKEDENP